MPYTILYHLFFILLSISLISTYNIINNSNSVKHFFDRKERKRSESQCIPSAESCKLKELRSCHDFHLNLINSVALVAELKIQSL